MTDGAAAKSKWRGPSVKVVRAVCLAWYLLVVVVLAFQAITYTGLIARLAEWQFARFGSYSPMLTLALCWIVLSSPALIGMWIWSRRRSKGIAEPMLFAVAERRALRFRQRLSWLTGAVAAAALVTLILGFAIKGGDPAPVSVSADVDATRATQDGPVRLVGKARSDRTAVFTVNYFLFGRELRVSPVMPGTEAKVRYFVQLPPVVMRDGKPVPESYAQADNHTGILRRNALPGELVTLYRYAGFDVAEPNYLLFRDLAQARLAYFVVALQLGGLALILLIFSLLQHFNVRRLRKERAEPESLTTA